MTIMTLDDMDKLMDRMGASGRDYRDFSERREPRTVSDGPRDWLLLQELGDSTPRAEVNAWREVVAAAEAFVKPELDDSALQDEFSAMLSWVVPEPAGPQVAEESPVVASAGRVGAATSFEADEASVDLPDAAATPGTGATPAGPAAAPQIGRLFQRYAVASRSVPVRATPVRSILARVAS
jgi:hypothetical protein